MTSYKKLITVLTLGLASRRATVAAQDTSPDAPTLANIAANCNAWHTVVSPDTCYSVEQQFGITAEQFLGWNPDVSSDCLTNFWPDYAYCVGVDASITISSSSSIISSTSSSKTASSTGSGSSASSSSSVPVSPTITTTTPYSTRYPVTSFNLTDPYTATAWPPARTQTGQPSNCNNWYMVVSFIALSPTRP